MNNIERNGIKDARRKFVKYNSHKKNGSPRLKLKRVRKLIKKNKNDNKAGFKISNSPLNFKKYILPMNDKKIKIKLFRNEKNRNKNAYRISKDYYDINDRYDKSDWSEENLRNKFGENKKTKKSHYKWITMKNKSKKKDGNTVIIIPRVHFKDSSNENELHKDKMSSRKRLEHFLPKRYHWSEEDLPHLGFFWFNGPQGRLPGPYKITY